MNKKFIQITFLIILLISFLGCSFPFGIMQSKEQAAQATLYAQLFGETPAPGATYLPETSIPTLPQKNAPGVTPQAQPVHDEEQEFPGLNIIPPQEMVANPYFDTSSLQTYDYISQPGDTLTALTGRFQASADQFYSTDTLPEQAYIPVGTEISIPNQFKETSLPYAIFPDSEIVYSLSSADFDTTNTIMQAGGYLSRHTELVDGKTMTGAEIVSHLAIENSINPRLLLAFLEFHTGWVLGSPDNPKLQYPIGFMAPSHQGLYGELSLVIRQLTVGYYGWRKGDFKSLLFGNKTMMQLYPELNAGSVAVLNLFSMVYTRSLFAEKLYGRDGFISTYYQMFGDPWVVAKKSMALIPDDLTQPDVELPFTPGERWVMTGGPHNAWGVGSPYGGLDFAPSAVEPGCGVSKYWVTASASGIITRAENGVLVIDTDGDVMEQTGWALVYLHIAAKDRPAIGTEILVDQPIGHPSCEGGQSTGTHVHISRKYNGEWIGAGFPVPFVLSGWQASPGARPYQGFLQKDEKIVSTRSDGSSAALIIR